MFRFIRKARRVGKARVLAEEVIGFARIHAVHRLLTALDDLADRHVSCPELLPDALYRFIGVAEPGETPQNARQEAIDQRVGAAIALASLEEGKRYQSNLLGGEFDWADVSVEESPEIWVISVALSIVILNGAALWLQDPVLSVDRRAPGWFPNRSEHRDRIERMLSLSLDIARSWKLDIDRGARSIRQRMDDQQAEMNREMELERRRSRS